LGSADSFFTNRKLEALIEAKEKLIRYQEERLKAMKNWQESDLGIKSWFEQLFQPSTRQQGYAFGFTNDPMYRAWLVITKLADLWGTEAISGDPIPDSAFNAGDPFRYASHHKTFDSMSMALYEVVLTDADYHPNPIESFSSSDLDIIENGLRRLYFLGLSRKSPISGQWVTKSDFKTIFPDTLKFKFRHRSMDYQESLYEIWANILTDHYSFDEKLNYINNKIQKFKDAAQSGENPFIALIKEFFPSAEERFFDLAKIFMEQFERVIIDDLFTEHSAEDLAHRWQIYMAQRIFNI
jgi:hypothetical protein